MEVEKFLVSETRKSLSLCLISIYGYVCAVDLASASVIIIGIENFDYSMEAFWLWY